MIRTAGPNPTRPSVGTLLRDLTDETRTLFRQEVELAKTELVEKGKVLGRNLAFLVAGGLVLYIGVLALIASACIGMIVLLAQGMDMNIALWLGPLIVGMVVALVGFAFVQKAISTLRSESLAPRKTIDSLRENTQWIRHQVTHSSRSAP